MCCSCQFVSNHGCRLEKIHTEIFWQDTFALQSTAHRSHGTDGQLNKLTIYFHRFSSTNKRRGTQFDSVKWFSMWMAHRRMHRVWLSWKWTLHAIHHEISSVASLKFFNFKAKCSYHWAYEWWICKACFDTQQEQQMECLAYEMPRSKNVMRRIQHLSSIYMLLFEFQHLHFHHSKNDWECFIGKLLESVNLIKVKHFFK